MPCTSVQFSHTARFILYKVRVVVGDWKLVLREKGVQARPGVFLYSRSDRCDGADFGRKIYSELDRGSDEVATMWCTCTPLGEMNSRVSVEQMLYTATAPLIGLLV